MSVERRGPAPASERGRAAAVPLGVVVAGAAGRMGSRIVACIHDSADLRVVAALEAPGHPALGRDAGEFAGLGRLDVALASDPARLIDLRRSLRPRMAASPLCDGPAFARKIEATFRTMWRHWCEAPMNAKTRSSMASKIDGQYRSCQS